MVVSGVLAAFLALAGASGLSAQASPPPDSTELLEEGRREQRRLERFRELRLPFDGMQGGFSCDERIGRFCIWYGGDDEWDPEPDDPEVIRRRRELIDLLDSLQVRLPGDRWIAGQRVYYRTEIGAWHEALRVARGCRAERWWCLGLLGYAQHVVGDFSAAERSFDDMLDLLDRERLVAWTDLDWILEGDAEELAEAAAEGAPSRTRLWALADPLYLVEGNDRRSAHFARRVLSEIRSRSRNPFQISWDDDLTEITVRFGWDRGWKRRRSRWGTSGFPTVSGRWPAKGRNWMPPGEVAVQPSLLAPGDWVPELDTPRNIYTPYYAPDLRPAEGQIAIFRRADSVLVVGAARLPALKEEDRRTEEERLEDIRRRQELADTVVSWPDLPPREGTPLAGLFLMTEDGDSVRSSERHADPERGLLLRAPAGRYWLSLEYWDPESRRAARIRQGVRSDAVPPDVVTLSDLLLLEGGAGEPERLEQTLSHVLPRATLEAGESVTVAWEIHGLGWEPETVEFQLAIAPRDGGFFDMIGDWFGGDDDDPMRVSWREPAPEEPGPWFRSNRLELRNLEAGEYTIQLHVRLRGREDLVVSRAVEVVSGR